jgi:SAM-dependent methyltransferase
MTRRAPIEAEVARHWNAIAPRWSEQVRSGLDGFREYFNNPAILRFVGNVSGKQVLDAGCGEGYNTRLLAAAGAQIVGADISPRMIALAQEAEQHNPHGIRYEVASFADLRPFANESFDTVVSFMALMDGPDFPAAARSFYRVLRPGGELCFSVLHPCFVTRGFDWIRGEDGGRQALAVGRYFDTSPYLDEWRFTEASEEEDFAIPRFPRTLAEYLNPLAHAGFVLAALKEPRPTERACAQHPWLKPWREHAALFLYVRAIKPAGVT